MPVAAVEQIMQAFRSQLDNIVWPDPLPISEADFPEFPGGTFIHMLQGNQEVQFDHGPNETRVLLEIELTVAAQVGAGELSRTKLNELNAEVFRVIEADLNLGLGDAVYVQAVSVSDTEASLSEGGPRQKALSDIWQVDFTMPFGDPYTLGG